jgi:membrane-bound ClpP family serine protease
MATSKEVPTQNEDFFTIVGNVFKLYEVSWNALKLNLATFIVQALIPIILLVVAIPFIMLPFITDGGTISILTTSLVVVALFVIGCIFLPALTIAQLESAKGNKLDVNVNL